MRSSRGRRVTTPDPLGRKSMPTIFSNKEDFPLDWVPISPSILTQNSDTRQFNVLMQTNVPEAIDQVYQLSQVIE